MINYRFIQTISWSLLISLLLGTTVGAQKKEEQTYTVLYSYEKQTRMGEKRYVLIPIPHRVKQEVYAQFKDRQRNLFKQLKESKSNTYGDTSTRVKQQRTLLKLSST